MNVLVACEESQRVCTAFRKIGCNAFSCDIQEPSGGHYDWHILGNALDIINGCDIRFQTMDNVYHFVPGWDLIIAHPPCTYLSKAGACRLVRRDSFIDVSRFQKGIAARDFFMSFYSCDCKHVAIENPIPLKVYDLPCYSQIIQPYQFGEPFSKAACLWLKNLPDLVSTSLCAYESTVTASWFNNGVRDRQKNRSKTFEGIASAMALQWSAAVESNFIRSEYIQTSLFTQNRL